MSTWVTFLLPSSFFFRRIWKLIEKVHFLSSCSSFIFKKLGEDSRRMTRLKIFLVILRLKRIYKMYPSEFTPTWVYEKGFFPCWTIEAETYFPWRPFIHFEHGSLNEIPTSLSDSWHFLHGHKIVSPDFAIFYFIWGNLSVNFSK